MPQSIGALGAKFAKRPVESDREEEGGDAARWAGALPAIEEHVHAEKAHKAIANAAKTSLAEIDGKRSRS